MRIYVLRHGAAESATDDKADAMRALTPKGKQDVRRVLKRARNAGARPSVILTSGLKRAMQTADIAAATLEVKRKPVVTDSLAPGADARRIVTVSRSYADRDVLIVGHEPQLSKVAALLLGCPDLRLDLKTGTMAGITDEGGAARARGTLEWVLTPRLAGG